MEPARASEASGAMFVYRRSVVICDLRLLNPNEMKWSFREVVRGFISISY